MDPVKILRRAWYILWNYRTLWIFGLVLAVATASSAGHGSGNNGVHYHQDSGQNQQVTPQSMQEAFREFNQELHKLFREGIPGSHISGEALTTFLWVIGAFVFVLL